MLFMQAFSRNLAVCVCSRHESEVYLARYQVSSFMTGTHRRIDELSECTANSRVYCFERAREIPIFHGEFQKKRVHMGKYGCKLNEAEREEGRPI